MTRHYFGDTHLSTCASPRTPDSQTGMLRRSSRLLLAYTPQRQSAFGAGWSRSSSTSADGGRSSLNPRTLILPADILPIALTEIQSRLESLVAYCCDIFIAHDAESIPLWRQGLGHRRCRA